MEQNTMITSFPTALDNTSQPTISTQDVMKTFGNKTTPGADHFEQTNEQVLWMLGFFAAIGTLGNTLVVYGFSRMLRQNLTSTVFVLTLAGTDLVTSVLIIPGTIYMEHEMFYINSDFICKFYHFLITSTVPYSIFLMVAIAVDRYLCICRPFLHCMNMNRARTIVICLAICAILLGITASLFYKVNPVCPSPLNTSVEILRDADFTNVTISVLTGDTHAQQTAMIRDRFGDFIEDLSNYSNPGINIIGQTIDAQTTDTPTESCLDTRLVCDKDFDILGKTFQQVFQRFYSSLFLIAVIIVSFLYILIYRAVGMRRRKTQRYRNSGLSVIEPSMAPSSNGVTVGAQENGTTVQSSPIRRMCRKISMRRSRKFSRRSDKAFLVNMRTAVTLFIVTLSFIIVFLPGWLMALRLITPNVAVFYLYFLHGVINPIIYAFLNETFRNTIQHMLRCDRKRDECMPVMNGVSQSTC